MKQDFFSTKVSVITEQFQEYLLWETIHCQD